MGRESEVINGGKRMTAATNNSHNDENAQLTTKKHKLKINITFLREI